MQNKTIRNIIICIATLVVTFILVGIAAFINETLKSKEIKNELYKITYIEDATKGITYDLYLYDDESIEIKKNESCNSEICEIKSFTAKELSFSEKSTKKAYDFLTELLPDDQTDEVTIDSNTITKTQDKSIINTIVKELEKEFIIEREPFIYRLTQTMENKTYYINYERDNKIKVFIIHYDNTQEIEKVNKYNIDFTSINLEIINNLFKNNFDSKNTEKDISTLKLDINEEIVLKSIIENNESYLDIFNKKRELIFEISSNRLNCMTPVLKVFNDNTYEYYDTFTTNETQPKPKKGTYNYDTTLILNSINKYEPTNLGPFVLKDNNGKTSSLYENNIELMEFLKNIDISLDVCTTQAQ